MDFGRFFDRGVGTAPGSVEGVEEAGKAAPLPERKSVSREVSILHDPFIMRERLTKLKGSVQHFSAAKSTFYEAMFKRGRISTQLGERKPAAGRLQRRPGPALGSAFAIDPAGMDEAPVGLPPLEAVARGSPFDATPFDDASASPFDEAAPPPAYDANSPPAYDGLSPLKARLKPVDTTPAPRNAQPRPAGDKVALVDLKMRFNANVSSPFADPAPEVDEAPPPYEEPPPAYEAPRPLPVRQAAANDKLSLSDLQTRFNVQFAA